MKKLTSVDGVILGPFAEIVKADDRWIADGLELPFTVVGEAAEVSEQGDWQPPPPPKVVPQKISRRQFRQALTRVGLRSQAEAYVAAGSLDLKDWWDAEEFERNHPELLLAAELLGQTSAQLDDLFILGGSL